MRAASMRRGRRIVEECRLWGVSTEQQHLAQSRVPSPGLPAGLSG